MEFFNKEQLLTLISNKDDTCISIYTPTYRSGTETLQNPLKFKHLLDDLEQKLITGKHSVNFSNNALSRLNSFVDDYEFWQHQDDGLAFYISEDIFRYYTLPIKFKECIDVGKQFYLIPILPMLYRFGSYYLLTLSHKKIRLYEGNNLKLKSLNVDKLSKVTVEEFSDRQFQKQLQSHTGPGHRDKKDSMFFGTAAGDYEPKKFILKSFQKTDKFLRNILVNKENPLILAGVDYLLPIYRQANSYSNLLDSGITGNPDLMSIDKMRIEATKIVEAKNLSTLHNEIEKYNELSNKKIKKSSSDLKEILFESFNGRIKTLFVNKEKQVWGNYNLKKKKLHIDKTQTSKNLELINLASINTIMNNGVVYCIKQDQGITDSIAAIFRY